MVRRVLVISLAATIGVLASSCASTARDTLVDIYNDDAGPTGLASDVFETGPDDSSSIGQLAVDAIDESRDVSCATDKRQIENAVESHFAFNGFDATTLDELTLFGVDAEAGRWMLQITADSPDQVPEVVPVVDGPCDN